MTIGIERIGLYAGRASLDVGELGRARGLDSARFANLLMRRKSLHMPFEDPVSFAVNAAKPMIDAMDDAERQSIRLLLIASESGVDFGKSMGTYVAHFLGLSHACRTFEIKQACYGGTAALRTAAALVAAEGGRALVICTDLARPVPFSYAEPSQGAAAVALLVGPSPRVLALEPGALGVHAYEVMDACRPTADAETGDADLSLLSYLDCAEKAFLAYRGAVGDVDFVGHFHRLAFHTPFGGMVKGAHRTLMRKNAPGVPAMVDADFEARMAPSLRWCAEVGNIYSGTVFLALAGALTDADLTEPRRIGLFSYGSGCCSEFYSGMAGPDAATALAEAAIPVHLGERRPFTMDEYEDLLDRQKSFYGVRKVAVETGGLGGVWDSHFAGRGLLVLTGIDDWRRGYAWS